MSNHIVAVITGPVLAIGAALTPGLPAAAPAAGGHRPAVRPAVRPAESAITAQRAAVRYWTPARMAAAEVASGLPAPGGGPVSTSYPGTTPPKAKPKAPARAPWLTGDTAGRGLRWTHGGAVANAVGKVFFTLGGLDYACTGALVSSKNVDIVLTAAHCVSGGLEPDGRTEWAADWLFVPGYRDGERPYGGYTARRFFISPRWTGPAVGREADDVAFVQVGPAPRNSAPHLPVPPPALPVKFAVQPAAGRPTAGRLSQAYVFGFPQEPPFTGLYPNFCAGPVRESGGSVRTDCGMTAGDSGGPWFGQFSPRTGTGTIEAVTTYKLSGNMRVLYGAVLGPLARAVYQRASTWR